MEPDIAAALRAVKKLVERPEAWTKGAIARDAEGVEVNETDRSAVCWCLFGAIGRVAWREEEEVSRYLCRAGSSGPGPGEITLWNDAPERTHADVLALLDRAIKEVEGE